MQTAYVMLGIVSLLPMLVSIIIYLLEQKTSLKNMNYAVKQVIIGIVFGCLAILGTEKGINIGNAVANCRDGAVLSAGLLFGGPAGIIAGLIGGIERWFAAPRVGDFTQVACTVSTIAAGFYSAALRKFMFENKKPGWFLSLAIGVVTEVFHLTMVFVTRMDVPEQAFDVVKQCSVPMILANGLGVFASTIAISLLSKDSFHKQSRNVRISQTIQRWLLVTVSLAFVVTTVFLFQLQTGLALRQADDMLDRAVVEVSNDIVDASNDNLLDITKTISKDVFVLSLDELANKYDVAEINIVDNYGIIVDSTNKDFVNFDMKSGEQSAKFLCLLGREVEYVRDYEPISYDDTIKRKYAGVRIAGGFLQVGYDFEHFQKNIGREIKNITKNRNVGSEGYIIIVDENMRLVSAKNGVEIKTLDKDSANMVTANEQETFEANINGEDCYCRYKEVEGYYIISVLPKSEALQLRNIAMYVNTYLEILIFAVLFVFIYLIIKRVVVNKIKDINKSLAEITGGNLDETINVRSNEEFASLSDDINSTVDTLKHYIDEASARIDKELEFAKNIQSSALPNIFPAFPNRNDFDIYACMDTAKEVGGDFYDFYFTRTNRLNFLIADVSGKGIPAAMFMMRAKSELKGLTETDLTLDDVFTSGNESLCHGNDAGMFVTAWEGSINLDNGLVQFANAGHNPPLVKHKDGRFEYLKSRAGFVLAGMEGIHYRLQELQLEPGDIIYLYTDGVTEATNSNNELYGEERLAGILNSRDFDNMKELCDTVKADVDNFVGTAEQFDDITMLALKFVGNTYTRIDFDNCSIDDIPAITDFVSEELEKLDCPMKTIIQINVAIDELYSNIVKFAYPNSNGPATVVVTEVQEPHRICITFVDEGTPYNPLVKEDPDITLSADDRDIGGLGIFMVKKTMDDMQYRYENGKNILTIIKNL